MSNYQFRANGYLIIFLLTGIYILAGGLYLSTLFKPELAGAFFMATSALMVGAIGYMLLLYAANAMLVRPAASWSIPTAAGVAFVFFYLVAQWAKLQFGVA